MTSAGGSAGAAKRPTIPWDGFDTRSLQRTGNRGRARTRYGRIELSVSWLIGKTATARLGGRFICEGHCGRRRVSSATTVLHTVAIKLKIPDNTAFSALTALRRLGVQVDRVERADIWQFAGPGSSDDVATSVKRNESLFNPNKHLLEVLESPTPRAGETWISNIPSPGEDQPGSSKGAARHYVAWRLFAGGDQPADKATVDSAIEKLLCNPAIERAIT